MLAKKKQILTATLLIALVAAVAVNWYYTRPGAAKTGQSTETTLRNLGDTVLVQGSIQSSEAAETTQSEKDKTAQDEYFSSAKLKRTNMHDSVVEEIQKLLSSESLSQEDKAKVTEMLKEYKESLKQETDCENLINSKLGGDCLVVINGNNAQVVLQKGLLNDAVLLQITEIIEKNTNISAENLTIIEAK